MRDEDQLGYLNDPPYIALHFNPRFPEFFADERDKKRVVVRNSRYRGVWGQEEREPNYFNPLLEGKDFDLKISVNYSSYSVIINGVHFCNFSHRYPYQDVSWIQVIGDVTVKKFQFRSDQFRA